MNKKATFTDAKVGDRVWGLTEGWGVVKSSLPQYYRYRLTVEFDNGEYETYTLCGLCDIDDLNPTLFWDEVKFEIPEKPMPQLEVDAKVWVWNDGSRTKYCRHFSHFENNLIYVFDKGTSSWTGISKSAWDNWELAE